MTDPDAFAVGAPLAKPRRDNTIVFEGARLGNKFRLLEPLGDGGMGKVWLAQHLGLGRTVALKVLHRSVHAMEDHRKRFEREARVIGQLDHPGIVAALDFGELEDGRNFLAMEYVPGRTLERIVREDGPLPWKVAVHVVAQVAEAIAFAHERGILHRDLKPDNLMVEGGDPAIGRVRILDLGLARMEHPEDGDSISFVGLSEPRMAIGTASYSAPEQLRGGPTDARADVYGLAAVLYYCIAGRSPYPGLTLADVVVAQHQRQLDGLAAVRPDPTRPPALDALIQRCLAHDPAARVATASAFAGELRALLVVQPAPRQLPIGRIAWGIALLAAGIVAGVLGATLASL
ncbi:MAG: serine/threonine-protein kinase [Sandaracinaceae bacterium]